MWKLQRRGAILVGLASTLAIGGLQFAPGPKRTNPAFVPQHTLKASTAIPDDVHALLRRSCMNCHSNETQWPWYSRIPPLSWGMTRDVAKARQALNFSEWAIGPGKRPAVAMGYLAAICADVKSQRMPLSKYLLLHREARLSVQDRDAICSWTTSETQRYAQLKINRAAVGSAR
jgi:hypothetical protein